MMMLKLFRMEFAAISFAVLMVPTLHAAGVEDARPNILFAIADDASYPHMGAYGCTWVTTPGFDRVARQGLLFTHAYPYADDSGRGFYERHSATTDVRPRRPRGLAGAFSYFAFTS